MLLVGRTNGSADADVMTFHELGGTVQRDIRTKFKWTLIERRQEGIVDHMWYSGCLRNLGDCSDVGEF